MDIILLFAIVLLVSSLGMAVQAIRIGRNGVVKITAKRVLRGPAARALSVVWFAVSLVLFAGAYAIFSSLLVAYNSTR